MRISEQPSRSSGFLFFIQWLLLDFFDITGQLVQRRNHIAKQDIHKDSQKDQGSDNHNGNDYGRFEDIPMQLPFVYGAYDVISHIRSRGNVNKIVAQIIVPGFRGGKGIQIMTAFHQALRDILRAVKAEIMPAAVHQQKISGSLLRGRKNNRSLSRVYGKEQAPQVLPIIGCFHHPVHITAENHPFFPGTVGIRERRGQEAEAVKAVSAFHLLCKTSQSAAVIDVGPGHFVGNQSDIADILIHNSIGRKLHQQILQVSLGLGRIGCMEKPFYIFIKKHGIENRIDSLKQIIHFPVEFLGGISGIGRRIFQKKRSRAV